MQNLPDELLERVANALPQRDARRLGQTFAAARTAVARSLARRSARDQAADRATRTLATRNRRVLALVTRLLHALETRPAHSTFLVVDARGRTFVAAGDLLVRQPGTLHGSIQPLHAATKRLAVKTAVPATRGQGVGVFEVAVGFELTEGRHARLWHLFMRGRQPVAERRLAWRSLRQQVENALRLAGYTVLPPPAQFVDRL